MSGTVACFQNCLLLSFYGARGAKIPYHRLGGQILAEEWGQLGAFDILGGGSKKGFTKKTPVWQKGKWFPGFSMAIGRNMPHCLLLKQTTTMLGLFGEPHLGLSSEHRNNQLFEAANCFS